MLGRLVVAALTVLWLTNGAARAEEPIDVTLGDKLRIRLEEGRRVGILEALDARALTLRDLATGEKASYSLSSVHGVEVSRARGSRGRKAGKGALIGGALGAAGGAAACLADGCDGVWTAIAVGVFGGGGALVGAVVGASISPGDAWRPARMRGLHASIAPLAGGAQIRVTAGF
ncbi:MAG TPA: hypothetical protein VLF95_09475 [Vicinamibacteria bacterium]|nr:hypothetical protein [Vicinamibacteria bacterium]